MDCPELTDLAPARLDGAEEFRAEWVEDVDGEMTPVDDDGGCQAYHGFSVELWILALGLLIYRRRVWLRAQ